MNEVNQVNEVTKINEVPNFKESDELKEPWWKSFWTMISVVYNAFPEKPDENHKQSVVDFFNSFKYLLPCNVCKRHFTLLLKTHPIQSDNKDQLRDWINIMYRKSSPRKEEKRDLVGNNV
jgi:hypothetical protein